MADLPPGVTLQQIDGGPNYYGSHGFTYASNAGWDDPSFFPIGLFLAPINDQSDVNRWKDLGLNTAFALTADSSLSLLRSNNISAILQLDELNRFGPLGSETVGLLSADEPSTYSGGVSTPLSTAPNSVQDGRFWWLNNTWNFIEYGDIGGVPAQQVLSNLITTPNGTKRHIDVQSVDIYWFAGNGNTGAFNGQLLYNLGSSMTQDQMRRGSHYGDMVDQIRAYQTAYPAPIAQIVENGGPYTENSSGSSYITPPELNWAVWSSIIHGARQIIYFNHSFGGPAQSNDNFANPYYQTVQPGQTISIYDQAKATNALIEQLAPVINSPTALGYVTVNPAPTTFSGIETMAKYYNGEFYIFADTRFSGAATNINATFTIKDTNATSVSVINENRTLPISNGTTFTDTFAYGSTVHIYKVSVTVDLTLPTIASFSTDSGIVGDGITNDNTLALTGTAEANSTVKVYDGGNALPGQATANSSGAWSYTTGTLSDATHSITATATDGAGNTSAASAALSVTVDSQAPAAPAISTFSTDSGTVGDGITNDNTLTLTGTAAANSTVKVYDGGNALPGQATANSSGAWSYTTGTLSDAPHSFTATATDAAGNTSVASGALAVMVDTGGGGGTPTNLVNGGFERGDFSGWTLSGNISGNQIYIAPTVFPGEVHTGSYSAGLGSMNTTDGILTQSVATTAGQHYTLSFWIASDNNQSTPINHFAAKWNGQTLIDVTDAPNSGYQLYTFDVVGNGNSVLEFNAYNHPDAWRLDDVTLTGVVASPMIASFSTDSGIVGDGITNDNTLALTGTAEANSTVKVYDGGNALPGQATANSSGAWSYTTGTLSDATHSITATATDGAGNTSAASAALSVTVDSQAPAAPAISTFSTDSGTVGDGITNDNTLTLTGTAAANSTVKVYDGGNALPGQATANSSGAWSYTTGTLSDAPHSFTATATDAAGNTSVASGALAVMVDTGGGGGTPTNLVNGGFERGDFSGWTLSGNISGNQIYIAPTVFPGEVHTGSYSAGLGSMNTTDGILTQSVATTAGQHYTLSFWIASDNNQSTPINHFAAKWNGQTLIDVTDAPNSGYQLYTFDVVGNGNSVLEFNAYNHPDAWRLDDVTLTAGGVAIAGSALTLDGDPAPGSHAPVLTEAALQHVIDSAIVYWAQHGADAGQLAMLKENQVQISDLGGRELAHTDAANVVTIDDDAAGYSWSVGLSEVNPQSIDLLSAVAHEFGHVLGYDHQVMDKDLAVGERQMPLDDDQREICLPAGDSDPAWSQFTGQVSGFTAQDLLDLADIAFGSNTTIGYAANSNNTGGTLSDGASTPNIALLGQYTAASFVMPADGFGGTLISDPPPATLTQTLTQPQHA